MEVPSDAKVLYFCRAKFMYRPTFVKRLFSYVWPITIERRKGIAGHVLEVIIYQGKVMLDSEKVNYSFGSLHKVMRGVIF
ncbi:hypothetical protein EB155_06930, partial [archaeon]|nr:hypothetical protein [archaeon]